jgi:hypothetical protein
MAPNPQRPRTSVTSTRGGACLQGYRGRWNGTFGTSETTASMIGKIDFASSSPSPRGAEVRAAAALRSIVVGALWCVSAGCNKTEPGEPLHPRELGAVSAPVDEPGNWCSDLRTVRICFAEPCPGGICVFPRGELPEHEAEYRCTGAGGARVCRRRGEFASPFVCARAHCVQKRPRLPDDSEWECADLGGAVLCRGGQQPAGVARVQNDAGWWCGGRRGKPRERVCIDIDPDFPNVASRRWACHFEARGAESSRVCAPTEMALLGDTCGSDIECPLGARCVRNACVPRAPIPNCWGGTDCTSGRCELGICNEDSG